ncbi:MAG: class I SAM-dependent methyltransferase [Acidimicrobiales bacterium]|nr:class I SAM-dependent methyltransferase [Acidimicrobiales bacterium]
MTAERHRRPMAGFDATTYGERFADVYDDWYHDVTDTGSCVDAVVALAHRSAGAGNMSSVLELGVGTGRLAIPLAEAGASVTGLDASHAMLDALAAKPGGDGVRTVLGDMVDPPLGPDATFDVVLVAYNTLFNLVGEGQQERCLRRSAELLAPGGAVVIEAFVPATDAASGDSVTTRQVTADRVVLSVNRTDADGRLAMGQYIDISEQGIRLRPWQIRWATPSDLDAMATSAGLVLDERWADWDRSPFTSDAPAHISVYRKRP